MNEIFLEKKKFQGSLNPNKYLPCRIGKKKPKHYD